MKTAMQNHIADMKKIQEMVKSKNLDKDLEVTILESIEGCIENAESFLETEKEQIIDASVQANLRYDTRANEPVLLRYCNDAEQYYQITFKSD